jgi:hypothetical protein
MADVHSVMLTQEIGEVGDVASLQGTSINTVIAKAIAGITTSP